MMLLRNSAVLATHPCQTAGRALASLEPTART